MRIILVGSVSTVKRLRVSLGTLVAIEATLDVIATKNASNVADVQDVEDVAATDLAVKATVGAHSRAPAIDRTIGGTVGAFSSAPAIDASLGATGDALEARTAIALAAIERAFEAIEQVNRLMHPTAEGSDLARINGAPLRVPIEIHRSVGQLLNLAKRINRLTEGVFDPCTPAQPGRLSDIEVSADESQVVCHAPVALDFGGFAKGYAVDCAIEALIASGCTAGLVNAGGDLRVFGQRSEPVFVRAAGGELISIELTNAALAVSDATMQQRPPEHQGYYVRTRDDHHLAGGVALHGQRKVSTADASPVATPNAQTAIEHPTTYAAVIASRAVVADALAKCVLLCLPSVASRTLHAFGATQPNIALE